METSWALPWKQLVRAHTPSSLETTGSTSARRAKLPLGNKLWRNFPFAAWKQLENGGFAWKQVGSKNQRKQGRRAAAAFAEEAFRLLDGELYGQVSDSHMEIGPS